MEVPKGMPETMSIWGVFLLAYDQSALDWRRIISPANYELEICRYLYHTKCQVVRVVSLSNGVLASGLGFATSRVHMYCSGHSIILLATAWIIWIN